jgi:iron complex transport system permease protein
MAKWREKRRTFLTILTLGLFLIVVLSTAVGSVSIPLSEVGNAFLSKIPGLSGFASPVPATYETIIFEIRLPRVILGVLVGAGLAVAGVALQGLFKNPMADPYIIGVSSGAALGATVAILAPIPLGLARMSFITLMAFLGALGAVFVVYKISKRRGKTPVETLLLAGIAIAAFLSAITLFLMFQAGEDMHKIFFWLMGGLSAAGWFQVKIALPCVIIGILILYLFARDMNVMLMGEEPAQHLGIEVETVKKIILAASTFIAAVVVSVSGIIGFVGLVTPHMVRILVGPDHRVLIPGSILAGGIILVFSDSVARTVFSPAELPVGVITALFGAPFFLYLLLERKKAMI